LSLYHDLIIDHYKNPRNFGVLDKPDLVAQEANASCGDLIEFALIINHQSSTIQRVAWRGVGCAISTAGASLLSEKIHDSRFKIQNLLDMSDDDMVEMLGGDISPTRLKCATLSLKALQKALRNSKHEIRNSK
jgi:nitrogen fixation NifU-like protein